MDEWTATGGDIREIVVEGGRKLALWHNTRERADTIFSAVRYEAGDGYCSSPPVGRRVCLIVDVASSSAAWASALETVAGFENTDRTAACSLLCVTPTAVDVFSFSLKDGKARVQSVVDREDPFVEACEAELVVAAGESDRWPAFKDTLLAVGGGGGTGTNPTGGRAMYPGGGASDHDGMLLALSIGARIAQSWGGGVELAVLSAQRTYEQYAPSGQSVFDKAFARAERNNGKSSDNGKANGSAAGHPPPLRTAKRVDEVKWRHKQPAPQLPNSLDQNLSNLASNLIAMKSFVTYVALNGAERPALATLARRTNGRCYYAFNDRVLADLFGEESKTRATDVVVRVRVCHGACVSTAPGKRTMNTEMNGGKAAVNFVPRDGSVLHRHRYGKCRDISNFDGDGGGGGGRGGGGGGRGKRGSREEDERLLREADQEVRGCW